MVRSRSVLARFFAFSLLLGASTAITFAQKAAEGQSSKPAEPQPTETLHAQTQLVIVDVVVQDRNGHPYHGLTRDDFVLTEQKSPQTIRNFEEHSAATQKPRPAMSPMPPGVFTDYTPVAPGGPLNVLLVDALNTPMTDQMYLRNQLLDFVKHEPPGAQVAIVLLTARPYMLQGFTSDPAILRSALESKLIAHASPVLRNAAGPGTGPPSIAQATKDQGAQGDPAIIALLEQADKDMKALQVKDRKRLTLDGFNALGHYLSNFPGRKNVLWFSAAFPLKLIVDPALTAAGVDDEFSETTNLLTRAQVAVYPIDPRGLMIAPMFLASNPETDTLRDPRASAQALKQFQETQIQEHATLEEMADDTGGQAFFNDNDLSAATAQAMDAGSSYYTLTYSPSDHNWNGAYRNIRVKLAGTPATYGLRLSYRHGYFADDPNHPAKHTESASQSALSGPALIDQAEEAYTRAAISHGAPPPEDILFKVQAVPLTGKDEDTVQAGNRSDLTKMKAPYRTYAIDYLALPKEFRIVLGSDGRHKGALEFTTYVYDVDGNVLNIADKLVPLDLATDTYKRFMSTPVRLHLLVSAPAKQTSYMRILIRDMLTNRYGVVEIPTSDVSYLPSFESQMNSADAVKPAPRPTSVPATKP